ncbi:MAG: hypothetical protein GF387_01140 [Candidatus Portnoybacteria bacterium]|nr:hypothetical protein [Candidatus Portnoybacteria bacterium]
MIKKNLVFLIFIIVFVGAILFPKVGVIEINNFYEEKVKEQSFEILFLGDVMLDRTVFSKTQEAGDFNHPFLLINDFLNKKDIVFANLESPITNNKSISAGGVGSQRMKFTASPGFVGSLGDKFDILGLANNHMLDFGEDGYKQTKNYLIQEGVLFFGDLRNREENLSLILEKNGIKIGLVGYHGLYSKNFPVVISSIRKIKENCDFVVVVPHWGPEYKEYPSESQKQEGRAFIETGADLVVGGHPHVIQSIEKYKGKYIFYSLGNFIFDQYFSKETMEGFGLEVTFSTKENNLDVSYGLFPYLINNNSQPYLATGEDKIRILNKLANISDLGYNLEEGIKRGFIK